MKKIVVYPDTEYRADDMPLPSGSDTLTISSSGIGIPEQGSLMACKDQTPTDPIEIAELTLSGICLYCRKSVHAHAWDCKHAASAELLTFGFNNFSPTITFNADAGMGTVNVPTQTDLFYDVKTVDTKKK